MRDFLSKKVKDLKPSGIRKFFDIAKEIEGCISLGVGEPDFDTPWHIREEGIYSLERGKTHYTSNSGLKELRVEISNYLKRKNNLDYSYLDQILVTVGGSEAIDLALRAMIEDGDEVIITTPCYVSYEPCAIMAGAKVVKIPLKNENEFRLTKEELEAAITPKSKILLMNFPNNPTGAIMEYKDLEEIAKVVIEHDLIVISDEIYSELTYFGTHRSIAEIPGMKEAYDERRRYLLYRLKEMGLPCFTPKGAFYVFPDIRKFGMTSEEFSLKLLKEKKVVVVPGSAFGESGEGFIRISYAYSIEDLKKALARVEEFIQTLK